jgi:hypothetical protein
MMNDLEHKAIDEKYFKSIRYFSHLLRGEKRTAFISELSDYNIYLAAQCLMSAEKDAILEGQLRSKAESLGRDFANTEKSANGFLALAEFESYEIIASLLIDVKKPSKVHLHVFMKILDENNLDVFISFIEILLKVNKIVFIQYLINSFNGQVVINSENKYIFQDLLNYLFANGNYGFARITLEKYNLFEDLEIILETKPYDIVNKLLNTGKKKLTATKLAYEISKQHKLFDAFPPSQFISLALSEGGKSNKSILLALGFAVEQKEFNVPELDERIANLLRQVSKKTKNKIDQLIKKGLSFYIDSNSNLKKMLALYQEGNFPIQENSPEPYKKIKSTKKNIPELSLSKRNENIEDEITLVFGALPTKEFAIELYWNSYFNYKNDNSIPLIQSFFTYCITFLEDDLRKVCSVIKPYSHQGIVKWNSDYGYYISPLSFRSQSLLFLHPNHVKANENQLAVEDEIKFRIIGYNKKSERVMISMLTDAEIEEQIMNRNKNTLL